MVTYLYWAGFIAIAMIALGLIGGKLNNWKAGVFISLAILIGGWAAYYFHFEQVFVKRWGGVMSIVVPAGQHHLGATWKDDNLWIENYDPASNSCIFSEYSRGNMLQGRVTIKDCNPLLPQGLPQP